MIMPDDPRVAAKLRELRAAALDAGYSDPLFGIAVIAAMALIRLEEEMSDARHPRGGGLAS